MEKNLKRMTDEDRLLRIRIFKLELPYLWYKNDVGNEFDVIDFRYENTYKVIDRFDPTTGDAIGYVKKDHCEIIKVIQDKKVPDFPFSVKVLKNSWFPQCWYASHIGEVFEITSGGHSWNTKHPNGNPAWIEKKDCEIIWPKIP